MDDVALEFTEEAVIEVARLAMKRKTGARSLRSIIEETLLHHMFALPDNEGIEKLIVTKETVLNNEDPIMVYRNESEAEEA